MKRRKINSLDEIWDGKRLKTKDFSNLDLEGLNLSSIHPLYWEGCMFHNTSVKNTGIRVIMNSLKGYKNFIERPNYPFDDFAFTYQLIKDCDFSDNDLNAFMTNENTKYTLFDSCDFTNTNVSKNIYGINNKLDKSFTCWYVKDAFARPKIASYFDVETLKNNPQLNIASLTIYGFIVSYLCNNQCNDNKEKIRIIEEYLKYDREGELLKLYNILKEYLSESQIVKFFNTGRIDNIKFKNVNFKDIDVKILSRVRCYNCEFDNLTLESGVDRLVNIDYEVFNKSNKFGTIITPNVTYSSWQEKTTKRNRIAGSAATFRTNLYLELGRSCNAKCEFCRNAYYCDNKYDLEKIIYTLLNVSPKINSIVIGGGEPTLKLRDLKDILHHCHKTFKENENELYLFTNGTYKRGTNRYIDGKLDKYNFNYNISRHAVDDDENARIFGIDKKKIMSTLELEEFIERGNKTTLAATCFKGGLDSKEKIIEYINYAIELGCKSILLSDLIVMEDSLLKNKENYNINIDDGIFVSVINYLMINGFKRSIPIYATGGYVLTMLKKGGINISFKHYISKKELEENWPSAIKRTFDLSIDPNGNLYENWHQTSGLVKTLKN